MNNEHPVSRRATLKSLGAVGATIVLGGAATAAHQADPKTARSDQDKNLANAADVAVERFGKGHS